MVNELNFTEQSYQSFVGTIYAKSIKGKTYEEIYGKERALLERNKRKNGHPQTEKTRKKIRDSWTKKVSKKLKEKHPIEKHPIEETKQKLRKPHPSMRGGSNPMHRLEVKEKFKNSMKKHWENKQFIENLIKIGITSLHRRPTNLEKKFTTFFQTHNLPLTYCGNGTLIIGGKNPDYVESNGKKVCLEVGNKYEKSIKRKGRNYSNWQEYEQQRINHFNAFNWKCLVVWEDELNDNVVVLQRLNNFLMEPSSCKIMQSSSVNRKADF